MIVLVIDTAFEQCQVGVWRDNAPVALRSVTGGGQHDRVLVPLVQEVFAEAGITIADISRILVTTGPGRFTGLRVGIAFARGLALIHQTPLAGVSTIDAIAYEARQSGDTHAHQAIVVGVKRGETYVMRLIPDHTPLQIIADDDVAAAFPPAEKTLLFGVASPELHDIAAENPHLVLSDRITAPSLQAIYATGMQADMDNALPVRPLYGL